MTDQTRKVTLMVTHPDGDGHRTLDHRIPVEAAEAIEDTVMDLPSKAGAGRHITLHLYRDGVLIVMHREVGDATADRVIAAMNAHMPERTYRQRAEQAEAAIAEALNWRRSTAGPQFVETRLWRDGYDNAVADIHAVLRSVHPEEARPADVPDGDARDAALRDQIAEALTREHYQRARERIEASPEEHCAAFADAVMAVVRPVLDEQRREIERWREHDATLIRQTERERDEQRQRADGLVTLLNESRRHASHTAMQRDGWQQRADDADMRALIQRAETAEATVERVRKDLAAALAEWQPEHDRARDRADRKGYSHDETEAEVYAMAINTVTAILDHPEETP
jgi:hypothetical protein